MNMKTLACTLIALSSPLCLGAEFLCTPHLIRLASGTEVLPTAEHAFIFDNDSMTCRGGMCDSSENDFTCTLNPNSSINNFVDCRITHKGSNFVTYINLNLAVPNFSRATLGPNAILNGVDIALGDCAEI